jgi:hypothetical protein
VAAKVSIFGHSTKLLGQKLAFVLFFCQSQAGLSAKNNSHVCEYRCFVIPLHANGGMECQLPS